MKTILSLVAVLSCVTFSHAQDAKLIGISSSGGLPANTDFGVRPMGYYEGIRLSYMVKGQNLIGFDKKSLKADGWELASFPKVSKNGDMATFTITKRQTTPV